MGLFFVVIDNSYKELITVQRKTFPSSANQFIVKVIYFVGLVLSVLLNFIKKQKKTFNFDW